MSSMGMELLSWEVSLGLKSVTPAHTAATLSGTDRAINTCRSKKAMVMTVPPCGNRACLPCTQLTCLPACAQRLLSQR